MHKDSEYVFFLDDDVQLCPGTIGALVAHMMKFPEVHYDKLVPRPVSELLGNELVGCLSDSLSLSLCYEVIPFYVEVLQDSFFPTLVDFLCIKVSFSI